LPDATPLPQRNATAAETLIANHANHTKAGKGLAADAGEEQPLRLGSDDSFQSQINLHGTFSHPSASARLRRDDAVKAWVNCHVHLCQILSARAEDPKETRPGQVRRGSHRTGQILRAPFQLTVGRIDD
jgi:hypothetical protein